MSWDDVSFVIASKNRKVILSKLVTPMTPTVLSKNANLNLTNVSRSLTELRKRGLVVCLTPKKRVGRIYGLTKKGILVLEKMKKMDEA